MLDNVCSLRSAIRWVLAAAAVGFQACARAPLAVQGTSTASHGACDGFEREPQRFWTESAKSGARAGILRVTGDYAAALADRVTKGMDQAAANWATVQRGACMDAVERKTMTPEVYAMVSACTRISLTSQRTIAQAMQSPTAEQVFELDRLVAWLKRDPALCLLEAQQAAYAPRESDRAAVVAARDGKTKVLATATFGTSDLDAAQHALGEAWAYGQVEDGPRWAAAIERGVAAARRSRDPKALVELLLSDARRLEDLESKLDAALERAREAERLAGHAGYEEGLRNSYFSIGSIQKSQEKFREALDSFQKSLAMTEKAYGKENRETGLLYGHVADVYGRLDNREKMLTLYRKSFTILEKAAGPDDLGTIFACLNVGAAYEKRQKHDAALEWYGKGLAAAERVLGTDHRLVSATDAAIGWVHEARGEHEKALEWLKKSVALQEKILGTDHRTTADAYAAIAGLYARQGKRAEALDAYRRALAIREKALGTKHADVAQVHASMGLVFYAQDNYAEALGCFEKARAIQEKVLGHDREPTGASYQNIGAMKYKLGKIAEAFQSFREAFAIFEKALGNDHRTTGATYDDIEHLCSNDNYQPACDFTQDHPRSGP